MLCQLCERDVPQLTVHHLIPRQAAKRKQKVGPTVEICSACHRQIHALFDNKVLAKDLNHLDTLKAEPQMQKFLAWIGKQAPDKRVRVKR
jgi:5-methylcytosine-specific restriction endonuclease McrA